MRTPFNPFPNLETQRLDFRQLRLEDSPELFVLRSDEVVLQYLDIPVAKSLEEVQQYIEKINNGIAEEEWIMWGITLKGDDRLVGTICFWNVEKAISKAELGYVLHPDFHRQGIMTEAIAKIVDYGFQQMDLQLIDACPTPDNLGSIKVLERNGFVRVNELPEAGKTTVTFVLRKPQN